MTRLWLCALVACTKDAAPREVDAQAVPVASQERVFRTRPPHRLGPIETTPRELFEDFTRPDADGIALLDKYAGGATFTATVKTVGVDEEGRTLAWIEVDAENVLSLDFASPSHLEPGARLTVTCRIGGASGALMMMTSCLVRDL